MKDKISKQKKLNPVKKVFLPKNHKSSDHNNSKNTPQNYNEEELKSRLTDLQYSVTRQNGTEPAFQNEYWNNHQKGIYTDIVSGEPLFSSRGKFDSGTGWPSFFEAIDQDEIIRKEDRSFGMTRIEVRSRSSDSHLGHLFPDGPEPTGLRYCINSASLGFVPYDRLEEAGYGEYKSLFEEEV